MAFKRYPDLNMHLDANYFYDKEYAVGCIRGCRIKDEDNYKIKLYAKDPIKFVYFAVFDGHNGIDVSEHASYELLKHIENSCEHFRDNLVFAIKKGFKSFDDLILSEQIKNVISNGTCSGSTAVCAFIDERNDDERIITIANLGNSKAILIDDDGIRFITKDHNPHDSIEKARIESAGHVVLDGKVDGRLNISRVFGRMDLKREDIEKAKTMAIERTPDVTRIPMLDKDRFLVLASDSVIKALDCARVDITTIINEQLRKNSYCLLDTVIAILNFCQSRNLDRCENMTLILISLKKLDKQFNEEDIQENEDFNERIKINTLALLDEKEIQTYGRDATIPIYHRLLKKFQDDIEKLEDFNIEDFKKKDFNERIKINTLALLYGSEIQKFCLGKTFPYLVSNKLSRNATFSDFEVRIERIVLAFLNEYKTRECDPSSIIPIRDILLKKLRSDIKNLCYKLTFIDRIVKNYFKQF